MYELTIVASFLKKNASDKDLVQRYIDHILVDNYKEEKRNRTKLFL